MSVCTYLSPNTKPIEELLKDFRGKESRSICCQLIGWCCPTDAGSSIWNHDAAMCLIDVWLSRAASSSLDGKHLGPPNRLLVCAGVSRKTAETHKCKRRLDSALLAGADCEVSFRHLKSPREWQSAAVLSRSKAPHIFSHGNCGLCDTLLQVLTSFLLATTKQIHPECVGNYTTLTLWLDLIKGSPSQVFQTYF